MFLNRVLGAILSKRLAQACWYFLCVSIQAYFELHRTGRQHRGLPFLFTPFLPCKMHDTLQSCNTVSYAGGFRKERTSEILNVGAFDWQEATGYLWCLIPQTIELLLHVIAGRLSRSNKLYASKLTDIWIQCWSCICLVSIGPTTRSIRIGNKYRAGPCKRGGSVAFAALMKYLST